MFSFLSAVYFTFIFAGIYIHIATTYQRYEANKKKMPSMKEENEKEKKVRSSRKRAKYTLHNAHTIFSEKKSLMKIYDFVNV